MDQRPLYVQRIDAERARASVELATLRAGLNELRRYLDTPKFRAPSERQGYVNVDDVLLRLNEATFAATEAGWLAEPQPTNA